MATLTNIQSSTGGPYRLTYAGVSFVLDTAKVVRSEPTPFTHQTGMDPVRKQQPLADLIDEIERLIPFQYLHDFKTPSPYPGRNLGGIAFQDKIGPEPSPVVRIGDWYYPNGASRWSVFRGLMTSSMVKEVLKLVGISNSADFEIGQLPAGAKNSSSDGSTIITRMRMLPPRPLGEHGANSPGLKALDGLYLVTLVDERYWWQHIPVSLRVVQATTWADLISEIATALGISNSFSAVPDVYGKPEPDSPLWTNQESAATLLDAIAWNLGGVIVRKLDGSYGLLDSIASKAIIESNRGNVLKVVRTAGGDMFASGGKLPVGNLNASRNLVIPNTVQVTFPKYVRGNDPVPHYLNPRYENQRPSAWSEESYGETFNINIPLLSGGIQFSGQIGVFVSGSLQLGGGGSFLSSGLVGTSGRYYIHDTAKAVYDDELSCAPSSGNVSGEPLNVSGLTALSMRLATDYWNAQLAGALDEVYPGIIPWEPEGIHDIVWTYSARQRQATTRVLRSEWNQTVREMQHSAHAFSGMTSCMPGVGGRSVAQSWTDSNLNHIIGNVFSDLAVSLPAGQMFAVLGNTAFLPKQNRWRGQINDEKILFEAVSGNATDVDIVWRGIDGTIDTSHAAGDTVDLLQPQMGFGVNLLQFEKMQFAYPGRWTSGGICEHVIIPQTQTVIVTDTDPLDQGQNRFWFGRVLTYNLPENAQFQAAEACVIVDRNGKNLERNKRYDGQFAGWSQQGPVYLVTEDREDLVDDGSGSGSGSESGGECDCDDIRTRQYRTVCLAVPGSSSVTATLVRQVRFLDLIYDENCCLTKREGQWTNEVDLCVPCFCPEDDDGGSGSDSGGSDGSDSGGSDGPPVETNCCPNAIARTLFATWTDAGGNPCRYNFSNPLRLNYFGETAFGHEWRSACVSALEDSQCESRFRLYCPKSETAAWQLNGFPAASVNCNPLQIVFNNVTIGALECNSPPQCAFCFQTFSQVVITTN